MSRGSPSFYENPESMIRVDPSVVPKIKGFAEAQRIAEKAAEKLQADLRAGRLLRFSPEGWLKFRPVLVTAFHGKCAYCETAATMSEVIDVEHYRPKHLYWWLAYDWRNMLPVCRTCSQRYKVDRFPVLGRQAAKPGNEADEQPILLNPYFDDPNEHIAFIGDKAATGIRAVGTTQRGQASVVVLGLNRPQLLRDRLQAWSTIDVLLRNEHRGATAEKLLLNLLQEWRPFAGACRFLFREAVEGPKRIRLSPALVAIARSLPEKPRPRRKTKRLLADFSRDLANYSIDHLSPRGLEKFSFGERRIERIEVKNLRAIRSLDLIVPTKSGREGWLMLIGVNGVGKSTVLKGVALALMGERRANAFGFDARTFVRRARGVRRGHVRVYVNAIGPIELRFSTKSARFEVNPPDPKLPLLAYGSTRLLPHELRRGAKALTSRSIRVRNLFDPQVPLSDAESWLHDAWKTDRAAFANVARALCRLLLLPETPLPRLGSNGLTIRLAEGWRAVQDLSDGYRSVLGLVVDISIGTTGTRQKPEEAVGIVILDEIELHLHPRWKISIVDRLRQVFPRMCFVVTTHDPLCLKGLHDDEIVILHRSPRHDVVATANMPSVETLKTDDILTSELFSLGSSRSTGTAVTVARLSKLGGKPFRTPEEEEEYQHLRAELTATFAGALTTEQREVALVVASVMRHLRIGTRPSRIPPQVAAEIRRQIAAIGTPR